MARHHLPAIAPICTIIVAGWFPRGRRRWYRMRSAVRGALVVLIPVLAVETLTLGQSAVGWLTAAIGAGGLVDALLHALGVRGTLAVLGGGLPVLALVHIRRFVRLDKAMPAPATG
jgi:hypothetical protein